MEYGAVKSEEEMILYSVEIVGGKTKIRFYSPDRLNELPQIDDQDGIIEEFVKSFTDTKRKGKEAESRLKKIVFI